MYKFKSINIGSLMVGLLVLLGSCSKNETIKYQEKAAVYFASHTGKDSIVYSFAGKTAAIDTVYLDVSLLGNKLEKDQHYKVSINKARTSAQVGFHYKALEDSYVLPAGSFKTKVPVVIYNQDTDLEKRSVLLSFTIENSEDLNAGYPDKLDLDLVITNQLVMPEYWNILTLYYGEYSKVKHGYLIQFQGHDFPPTLTIAFAAPYGPAYWMSYGRKAAQYFTDHVVLDENDNRIIPWSPF